jgi:hypothetical protein
MADVGRPTNFPAPASSCSSPLHAPWGLNDSLTLPVWKTSASLERKLNSRRSNSQSAEHVWHANSS